MDHLNLEPDFRDEVVQVMRDNCIDLEEALYVGALRRGQVYGAGDIVFLQPLSAEERRALGIDHDPEEILARDLARRAKGAESDREGERDVIERPVALPGSPRS